MTKLAPEWVRTSDPVIRSPARYRWTTAPASTVPTAERSTEEIFKEINFMCYCVCVFLVNVLYELCWIGPVLCFYLKTKVGVGTTTTLVGAILKGSSVHFYFCTS